MSQHTITAALLVIGDEILSGRTKDKNIGYIAEYLTNIGIDLKEVRVVPDEMDEIIEAVNKLRARYTYLFTTGGIGPTHDDITADAVSRALGVELYEDPRIIAAMLERLKPEDLNEARRRMARIPVGAEQVAMMETIEAAVPEGTYAAALSDIAKAHPDTIIGSYPQFVEGRFRNQIVVRSKDGAKLQAAVEAVSDMLKAMPPANR